MIKHIIASCSSIAIIVGYLYGRSEGLIVSINNGIKNYSNIIYNSSGRDDGSIVAIGFMAFTLSLVFTIINYLKLTSNKILKLVYTINYLILLFLFYLVNLDISIINSIKYGDYLLLIGLIITTVPFFFFLKRKAT